MTSITIYERNGWKVTSYGNGWLYVLECDGKSVGLQDEDAEQFRADTMGDDGFFIDNCEERFADYSDVLVEVQS